MVMLRHAVKIAAPRAAVYRALTTVEEMSAWHEGRVTGAVDPGAVLVLEPHPGLRLAWRTDALAPLSRIVQTCVEGPGTSPGRTLTVQLADADGARTLVELSDADWPDDDPHLPFCNAHWGATLLRLKGYAEAHVAADTKGSGDGAQ